MNPVEIGEYDPYYCHDSFARGDTLYAAHIYDGFFSIVDVSDPAAPVLLGTKNTPSDFTHNTWLDSSGDYLFTTDERTNAYVGAYDVSDPTDIQLLDQLQTNPGSDAIIHNTYWLNAVLAVLLARQGWRVVASDVSQAAVRATLATAAANGVADRVEVGRWAGVRTEAHPVDLVVSNPPFHRGAAKDSAAAFEIVDGASAALAPGGELRLVFNAHLPYLPYARRVVGPTRILARTRDYLVTCSTRS